MMRESGGPGLMLNRAGQFLSEYLLLAPAGKELADKIQLEKIVMGQQFHQVIDTGTKPGIPLASFLAKEMMEDTLIRWIQKICNLQNSFKVEFQQVAGIAPHTICLKVEDPAPFKQLANQLRMVDGFVQSNDCPPVLLFTQPYLPLTGNLPEAVFHEVLQAFGGRQFQEGFEVCTLVLLKRDDAYQPWRTVNQFTLPPQPLYE